MKNIYNKYVLHIIASILFFLLSVYLTYPLLFHLGDFVTGYGDELNIAWIYNWVIHVFLSGNIFMLYDTNIFYPFGIALSDSDPNILTSLLAIVPLMIIKQPIAVVNFTLISSLMLLGISVYLLCYYLTKDFFASLFAGILVICSPATLSFYVHIQMLAIAWVPLAILFFLHFIKSKKSKYLNISLLFFVIQIYNSFIPGYFILFSYFIIFFYSWLSNKKQTQKLITKKNIFVFLFSFLLTIPILIPYFQISKQYNYTRDIRDAVHLAIQPEDLFYSSGFSRFYPFLNSLPFNKVSQNFEFKPGYIGFIFSLLTIVTIVFFIKNFKKINSVMKSFVTIALLGLVLSLGPVLHLGRHTIHEPFVVPLPYALFYYIVPGFQGFRNAARWEMLFILAMALAIAILLSQFLKRFSSRKKVSVFFVLIACCIGEFNYPMHFERLLQVKDFPSVYRWLATTPQETKIIEMPMYNWNMFKYAGIEYKRMYYSTTNFRKTVNGGGGFTPPPWEKLAYDLDATFPSQNSIEKIKLLGVDYMIIHKNEFDQLYKDKFIVNGHQVASGDNVIKSLLENKTIRKVKKFQDDYVFEL